LMTGTHPAALPAQTLADEDVDFVVDSEGPVTIASVAAAIKAGRRDFSLMPSLWWKHDGGTTKPAQREPLLEDLDADMPGIAWDLLDMSRYRAHNWHSFAHIHDR